MGSVVTRAILMVAGYAYPAYECFKGVERSRPDIESLRFWCQYWMIIALLTIFERVGDTFVSWLPMYNEAKLAFVIYLWYPKTQGATYIYCTFLKPYVAKHEPLIDRHLDEFKARAGDLVYNVWQKGAMYVQARFLELLHYVASQTPTPPVVTQESKPGWLRRSFTLASNYGYTTVANYVAITEPADGSSLPAKLAADAAAASNNPHAANKPAASSELHNVAARDHQVLDDEESDYDIVEAEPDDSTVPEGFQEPLVNRRRAGNVW